MGYMNEFPHTRTFDSDLREIIDLYLTLKNLPKDFETLQKNFDDLKTFVTNYFNNLDVQTEIDKKLDEMLNDGSLEAIFNSKFTSIYNVKLYGAVGDGSTDDTKAINDAITAAGNYGIIYFPSGVYCVSSTITVGARVSILGCGNEATIIKPIIDNITVLHLSGNYSFIKDVCLIGNDSGNGLVVSGSVHKIEDIRVNNFSNNIQFNNASTCVLDSCYITSPVENGLLITSESGDTGDNSIINNTFDSSKQIGTAITLNSGGGLKLCNNKILHYNIALDINCATSTSVLNVANNSFESQETFFIRIVAAANCSFSKCTIIGNEFASAHAIFQILQNTSYIVFSNNFIEAVNGSDCFVLQNTAYVTINNNLIKGYNTIVRSYTAMNGLSVYDNQHDGTNEIICVNTFNTVRPTYFKAAHPIIKNIAEAAPFLALTLDAGFNGTLELDITGVVTNVGFAHFTGKYHIEYNGATYTVTPIHENNYGAANVIINTSSDASVVFTVSSNGSSGMNFVINNKFIGQPKTYAYL